MTNSVLESSGNHFGLVNTDMDQCPDQFRWGFFFVYFPLLQFQDLGGLPGMSRDLPGRSQFIMSSTWDIQGSWPGTSWDLLKKQGQPGIFNWMTWDLGDTPETTLVQWCIYLSPSLHEFITLSSLSFNSLAPGRPGCHFKTAIFNLVLLIGIFTLSKDNTLRWMPRDLTDDKSTLVQVMAWCRQATSHYLSQCWPSSMSPYSVTRPQWVKKIW